MNVILETYKLNTTQLEALQNIFNKVKGSFNLTASVFVCIDTNAYQLFTHYSGVYPEYSKSQCVAIVNEYAGNSKIVSFTEFLIILVPYLKDKQL